ncbi:uncharacterized protein [Leptinotarsa decemlineata]|uniref:uncharacterized protein n=1 Tax=Leptinotarsa decemlineata TaxID=7539 RepID=UPI003D30C65F
MGAGHYLPINSAASHKISSSFVVSCSLLLLVLHLVGESSGLRLTSMNAPPVADLRDGMELDCHFDMGTEDLYAVKWYKDDHEFFRYMPHRRPNTMLFPVAGIHLEPSGTDCRQNRCKIRLENLSRAYSGGAYRCEISSEAPAFRLASETHNVIVAALPRSEPKIEGLASSYLEGDTVSAKCISDFADPEPILSWKINDQEPAANDIIGSSSTEPDSNGLVSRSITLRFPIERKASRGNSIEIRCESALPGVPIPKQITSLSVLVRNPNDPQVINNQKLHWSTNGVAKRPHRSFHIAWTVIWVVVVKWSIARILK